MKWVFVYFVAYLNALYVITVECANSNNTIMENETLFYERLSLGIEDSPKTHANEYGFGFV